MELILKSLTRIKKINAMLPKIVQEEAIKESKFIATLNREQLMEGLKATGQDMPEYVENSKHGTGKINLFDTGMFQEGIAPLFDDSGIENIGTDEKTSLLVGKYGEILGLTTQSIELLNLRLLPRVQNRLNKLIQAG